MPLRLFLTVLAAGLWLAIPQPIPDSLLFHARTLPTSSGLACNDGSPIVFYYRNCTGNWDRKSGAPDFCDVPITRWVVHFGGEIADPTATASLGAFCYDARSCAQRRLDNPNATSSLYLPDTLFPDGIVIPFAEVNPNLYLQNSVLVPHCTSDLFAGTQDASFNATWKFDGAAVVEAVLHELFNNATIGGPTLADANTVVLAGGPGIMARLDELSSLLQSEWEKRHSGSNSSLQVLGYCAGCLLEDLAAPPLQPPPPRCTSDANCPPRQALSLLDEAARLYRPAWCNASLQAWECYLAPSLLRSLSTATTRVLLELAQFDARQLRSYGIPWPLETGSAEEAWATGVFAPAVVASAVSTPSSFAVAVGCPAPTFILVHAYYATLIRHVDSFGRVHNDSMSTAVSLFLENAEHGSRAAAAPFGTWGDHCNNHLPCNPSC